MYRNPKQGLDNVEPIDTEPFDVDTLLSKCGTILQREIRNLLIKTSSGVKLDRADSQDLIAYIKVLSEVKGELEDAAKNMSDDELKKVAK